MNNAKMRNASQKYRYAVGVLSLTIAMLTGATAVAQEYKYEIGGEAGASAYLGDANQTRLTEGLNASAGLVFRRNFNLRWALKADLMYGRVSGDTRLSDNVYPANAQADFSRNFFELGGQMEFNFLPYSDKFAYLNSSRIAPYLLAGLGLTLAPGDDRTFFGLNLPLGCGVKYKIVNRVNLGVEFAVHKLFGDDFDAPRREGFSLDNPYGIRSGAMKNKDWFNTLMLSITWDFGPNDRQCTNL
jgi:hypothetical protein